MELNRENIIKALECISRKGDVLCEGCDYRKYDGLACHRIGAKNALSLIKEQEQKIFEIENRLKECENGYEGTLFLDRCKLHDAEEKVKELTEENERLKGRNEHLTECLDIEDKYKERLRGILLQFTDIVHKWGNKNGYDTSEIALIPVLYEENTIKAQIKADTVRKMQERLKKGFDRMHKSNFLSVEARQWIIDQIAKEMLEGEK